MARLNLTVEGQTEQVFVLKVLQPHLIPLNLAPRRALTSRKKNQRGGIFKYQTVKHDIQRWLKQDRGADVWFTTMFDLYGLPKDFPAYSETQSEPDPLARVKKLEEAFANDMTDSRFIPYIQLHEFEALLLSRPAAFTCYYPDRQEAIAALVEIAAPFPTPEAIDDGEQTAPSKRIGKEIPEYLAAKPTAGPIVAQEIGLDAIRGKCPHFNEWLTKLEGLATLA